jgi:hypothetical protein
MSSSTALGSRVFEVQELGPFRLDRDACHLRVDGTDLIFEGGPLLRRQSFPGGYKRYRQPEAAQIARSGHRPEPRRDISIQFD